MKKILIALGLIISFTASAQWTPTGSKTRFVNGIGLSAKDTATYGNTGDTLILIVGRDSTPYFKYKGYWKKIAIGDPMVYPGAGIPLSTGTSWGTSYGTTGSGATVVLNGSPTLITPSIAAINVTGGIAALPSGSGTLMYYADTNHLSDRINLKLNISDTASMLSHYPNYTATNEMLALKLNLSDTSGMLGNYYNKTASDSRLALKFNISDTATMLGNYVRTNNWGITKSGQAFGIDTAAYKVATKTDLSAAATLAGTTYMKYSDTAAALGGSYYNKTYITSNLQLYTPVVRTLTINGTPQTLASDRSWSVGTVTSVATDATLTGGTITSTGTLKVDTSAYKIATKTDLNTYTGSSSITTVGTLSSGSIPYSLLTGTPSIPSVSGTTNYIPKFTASSTLGNSLLQDNGSVVTSNGEFNVAVSSGNNITLYKTSTNFPSIKFTGAAGGSSIEGGDVISLYLGVTKYGILNTTGLTLGSTSGTGTGALYSGEITVNSRTQVTSGGVYDLSGTGNNIGIGFGAGAIFSTNGAGTLTAQNLGSSANPWGALYSGAITSSGDINQTAATPSIIVSRTTGNGYVGNVTGGSYSMYYGASHATKPNYTEIVGAGGIYLQNNTTITGSISAGSGTFSGSVTSGGSMYFINTGGIFASGAALNGLSANSTTNTVSILTNGTSKLDIAPTGAATFSSSISAGSGTFSGALNLTGTANTFQVASIFRNANRVFFGGDTGGYLWQSSANATILTLTDAGAITASSPTNTFGVATAATNQQLNINGVNAKAARISFQESGVDKWLIGNGAASENGNFEIYNTSGTVSLSINKTTNAITASSSVTAVGLSSTTTSPGDINTLIRNSVTSASATTGYGLVIESEASAATSYALTVRDLAASSTYLHILTETGKVGWVGFGTTSPSTPFHVASGEATFSSSVSATSFFETSDIRLKNIIKRDGDVAYYTLKSEDKKIVHIGYIAQEKKLTNPDQTQANDKGMLSLNYVEILVQKVRELEKKLEKLEKKTKKTN